MPCIWLDTHPCNWPHYGSWINYFFTIHIHKYFFLPLLLVFVMEYHVSNCIAIALCFATPIVVCIVHLLCAWFKRPSAHASTLLSLPMACPPSPVLRWCILCMYYKTIVLCNFFMCIVVLCLVYCFCKYFHVPHCIKERIKNMSNTWTNFFVILLLQRNLLLLQKIIMEWWKHSKLQKLISECEAIQTRLNKAVKTKNQSDRKAFCRLMLHHKDINSTAKDILQNCN